MTNTKRVIEINGVKMEVDLSQAKVVDQYKIGDNVKVLKKEYSDSYKSYIGTIVAFDDFKDRPNIVIAYLDVGYNKSDVEFIDFNKENKDVQIAPLNEYDIDIKKSECIDRLKRGIDEAELKVKEAKLKLESFEKHFGRFFDGSLAKQVL